MLILRVSSVEPRGLELGGPRQLDSVELLHQVAEHRALGTARGLHLLLQLVLVVGLARGANHDGLDIVVVVDAGQLVLGLQHTLVEQVADRQQPGMIPDRHHRHDLARVEEQRQRPFRHHRGRYRLAVLVDALDRHRQPWVVGIGPYLEFLHRRRPRLSLGITRCMLRRNMPGRPGGFCSPPSKSRIVDACSTPYSPGRGRQWWHVWPVGAAMMTMSL